MAHNLRTSEGLQYELGINDLVQSFGPTTQNIWKQKLGNLNASFKGINNAAAYERGSSHEKIFKLLQGAFIAKGIDLGLYDFGTSSTNCCGSIWSI